MEEPQNIGKWIRISVLGSGGFGTVILWRNPDSNDCIAVKKCKLHNPSSLSPKQKQRWCNEVQIMKELNHSNIVKYKPLPLFFEEELNKYNPTKMPLLSMEYCRRGNLRHALSQPTNLTGLKEESVRNVLLDMSGAVSYLHARNITHRDIKPENIVLDECSHRSEGVIYKLIDLGYAKELGDATVSFVGSLYYIAPEILINKKYDCSVDYWSLGITTFEVICGVLPFCANLSPIERFKMLKNKGENDICFYKSKFGNYLYSTKLFNENHISSCLKTDMELWLCKVLKFRPELRSVPFSNSQNVFDQLRIILSKKRVNIFCVSRYKFLSYEFDETTKLSMVKQWIMKETEIEEHEQLFFSIKSYCEDEHLLTDILPENNSILYLFQRSNLFNINRPLRLPRLVKSMFENTSENLKWRDIKAIYSHSIHYISSDITHAMALSEAIQLFLDHLQNEIKKLDLIKTNIDETMLELSENLGAFLNVLRNNNLKNSSRKKNILQYLVILKNYCKSQNEGIKSYFDWLFKTFLLNKMFSVLRETVLKLPELEKLLNDAIHLLKSDAEKSDQNNTTLNIGAMTRIVSKTVKIKDEIFSNDNLRLFMHYVLSAKKYLEDLLSWMHTLSINLEDLLKSLVVVNNETIRTDDDFEKENTGLDCDFLVQEKEQPLSCINESVIEVLQSYQQICDNFFTSLGEF